MELDIKICKKNSDLKKALGDDYEYIDDMNSIIKIIQAEIMNKITHDKLHKDSNEIKDLKELKPEYVFSIVISAYIGLLCENTASFFDQLNIKDQLPEYLKSLNETIEAGVYELLDKYEDLKKEAEKK